MIRFASPITRASHRHFTHNTIVPELRFTESYSFAPVALGVDIHEVDPRVHLRLVFRSL
jgi:hypothetical protein